MANVLNGNTFYIDSVHSSDSDDLVRKQALIAYIAVTATGANGRIVLTDVGAPSDIKLDLRVEVSGHTELFRFDEVPVIFPNGVRVSVLSNAVATLVIRNSGG